ncbi:MAG: methyltransferase domain-containing protein [Pseudomonadota bacterium]|nr:methyltransferase domain-containing protein [Pseudomonadota bacterium]
MRKNKQYFPLAYKLTDQEQINNLYDQWAVSYDEELKENLYRTPERCALALQRFVPKNQTVLDFGCGTGLSGQALIDVGYTSVIGTDINERMLWVAKSKGIYKKILSNVDLDKVLSKKGLFSNIIAVGVISSGAGPPSLLMDVLAMLEDGGFLCFSFNDHTLADEKYIETLELVKEMKLAEEVFTEYGSHLIKRNVGSQVFVLKKASNT